MSKYEMSRYIDLDLYHEVERSHPFYKEMIQHLDKMLREMAVHRDQVSVLELGAGTGLFTEELLKIPRLEITALEIDTNCCKFLERFQAPGNCAVIQGDAVTFQRKERFDVVVSTFAHDHIRYDRRYEFAKNIRANLKTGGLYLMGGEILPSYRTEEERIEALYLYHLYIINKALREGGFSLAQIEINALESGIKQSGDFKRHERMFEEEMLSAHFKLIAKDKMGPSERTDVGGVFVYVFQAD